MLNNRLFNQVKKIVKCNIEKNVSLKNHTTFRIGGNADIILYPTDMTELVDVMLFLKKHRIKYFIFGLGSNILVSDNGFDGVAIKLGRNFNRITVDEDKIIAFAGASLNSICMSAYNHGLTGLEDAFGIPGTIGGAVIMNAGAYQYETKNVVTSVLALVHNKIEYMTEFDFGHRKSVFQCLDDFVILEFEIQLKQGNKKEIYSRMNEILNRRKENQPLNFPSAGSIFKRCEDIVVSLEIDKMGLKGKRLGKAEISTKHAGFIVNRGGASAKDVKDLIQYVKDEFEEKHHVKLQEEIKYIGE